MYKKSLQVFNVCISLLLASNTFAQDNPVIEIDALEPVPVPVENPITEAKRVLGKILFWDEQLSSNNTVACGTCHMPASGGSDNRLAINPGIDLLFGTDDDIVGSPGIRSLDVNGLAIEDPLFGHSAQVTGRAAQTFLTAMYADSNFWDGRASDSFVDPLDPNNILIASGGALESQAVGPILSSVEMAKQSRTWADVTEKLAQVSPLMLATKIPADMSEALLLNNSYTELFERAFGDGEITPGRIAMAIATYERTLFPDQSPWDLYMAGDDTAMTARQIDGWEQFLDKTVCDNCHVPPLFTDNLSYNIGLRPAVEDIGLLEVTGVLSDLGRFKTPSLRNIGLRKSLMHVGWITDMQDAVDFYNAGSNETQHTQFPENQTDIPTRNSNNVVEYETLSFFGESRDRQAIIIEFLNNALTDPRVAAETFPFDRPVLASELAPAPVKLMSLNVQSSAWDSVKANSIAALISSQSADVIALQEAESIQKADLLSRLQNQYDFYTFQTDNSHPILLKKNLFQVLESGAIASPVDCVSQRYINYLLVQQVITGHQFVVYNSQFCSSQLTFEQGELSGEQRNQSHAQLLAQTMENHLAQYQVPVVALGDFNATRSSTTMRYLLDSADLDNGINTPIALNDSWQLVNSTIVKEPLTDWILSSGDITVLKAAAIDAQVSDHMPLTATVVIEGDKSFGDLAALSTSSDITQSSFRGAVSKSSGNSDSTQFSTVDKLSINTTIYVDKDDVGSNAELFTIVIFDGNYYMKNSLGAFLAWDGTADNLVASEVNHVLNATEAVAVISGLSGFAGDFQILIAYSTGSGVYVYNQEPIHFQVVN